MQEIEEQIRELVTQKGGMGFETGEEDTDDTDSDK